MADSNAPDAAPSVPAETILAAAIGVVSLIVLTMGLLMWNGELQHRNEESVVQRVRSARFELVQTSQAQADAEAIAARYAATGNRALLTEYADAKAAARQHIAALRTTVGADAEAAASVARLERLLEQRIAALDAEATTRGRNRVTFADDAHSIYRNEGAALFVLLNGRIDEARRAENETRLQLIFMAIALALLSLVGSGLGILALRRERTQWRLAHAAAEDARAKAAASDLAKTRFLAVASHDMRQPLHALTLYLTALERRVDTAETRDIVAKMDRAVQSMIGMFASLLDLARLQAGVITPEIEDAPLQPIFEGVAAEHPGGKVEIAATGLAVHTDPRLLARVISNLAANAVKHGGSAKLKARSENGDIIVTVADDGPGIAPEDQERIFNEFERLGARTEGLGLGLTIVRRVATLLGLKVRIESALGAGTRFIVRIPRAHTHTEIKTTKPADAALRGLSVLAMDDDALARGAIEGLLSDLGADVRACADGGEAEALVRQGYAPHLLVLDLRINGHLLGLEIAHHLRSLLTPPPPVIMITGDTEPQTLEALRASGHKWLIKPINPAELGAAAEALLMAAPR